MPRVLALLVALGAVLAGAGSGIAGPASLPAVVSPVSFDTAVRSFRTFAPDGSALPDTSWRVVRGTGNCCENYLATSVTGRLVDIGGSRVRYTDDRGLHWIEVSAAIEPSGAGEGAAVGAPNGDIVAMSWFPYAGDRVVAYRYTAATGEWRTEENVVHTPFFDRPWIGLAPGVTPLGALAGSYTVILRGGWPSKELEYHSYDGLTYLRPSSRVVESVLPRVGGGAWPAPEPLLDRIQPHSASQIAPLSSGALTRQATAGRCSWMTMAADARWGCVTALGDGHVLVDGAGRLHRIRAQGATIDYAISSDGGSTWATHMTQLPAGYTIEEVDVKATVARAAVALHTHHGPSGNDQDLLYLFDTTAGVPALERVVYLGRGDLNFDSGILGSRRFDFSNVVIFPDGKVAASFVDSIDQVSAIAFEL